MEATDGTIKGMTVKAPHRRIKRSFTLDPEVLSFLSETRRRRRARSDSEALHLLLSESMLRARRKEIDAAFADYYDSIPDSELAAQQEWAHLTGPNLLLDPAQARHKTPSERRNRP
jgi:hypothetical protein